MYIHVSAFEIIDFYCMTNIHWFEIAFKKAMETIKGKEENKDYHGLPVLPFDASIGIFLQRLIPTFLSCESNSTLKN